MTRVSTDHMTLPFKPPVAPMLAKLANEIPDGEGWLYEPKWDGFRAMVFKDGDTIHTQSRDLKPLDRYFPELTVAFKENLPERCVLDGEIVIATNDVLDFDSLLLRIHPAATRVEMLSKEKPASFVAWDILAMGDEDLRDTPQLERRAKLELALANVKPPIHMTPATRDKAIALDWFMRFEGAGLDGVMAKPIGLGYLPNKRAMIKVKHARTADCVVAGFRWYKGGKGALVGSFLLGLYDNEGILHHAGICASFTQTRRAELAVELEPLREGAKENHPWKKWAEWADDKHAADRRMPGAKSRWNRGKDLSWEPIRLELACEVGYDHLQGDRFRHGTHFKRWRPDKPVAECRYDQLEVTPAIEIRRIFG
jgi:ATP-dependent DNA ligase